jgi:hypothetical protein
LENQILRKASDLNYDTEWVDAVGGSGSVGATGPAGPAATVAVGTVATGAAGSAASVTNAGTSSAATLDFTIPRGDTGVAGAAGATGATGPSGVVAATAPLTYNSGTQTVSTSMATNRLLGRSSAGTGVAQEIALGTGLLMSGSTLNASVSSPAGNLLSALLSY